MLTKINELLQGEMISKEATDQIFNHFENQLLDREEIVLDLERVNFISVYFLERLEKLIQRAKNLNIKVKITNVKPAIYKVFQVGRVKEVLELCS